MRIKYPTQLLVGQHIIATVRYDEPETDWCDNGTIRELRPLADGGVEIVAGFEFNSSGTVDFYADDQYTTIELVPAIDFANATERELEILADHGRTARIRGEAKAELLKF